MRRESGLTAIVHTRSRALVENRALVEARAVAVGVAWAEVGAPGVGARLLSTRAPKEDNQKAHGETNRHKENCQMGVRER